MPTLYYASPDFARFYSSSQLSHTDQIHLRHHAHREQHIQWQVSRALKAFAPCEQGILSHSQNHAAWLVMEHACSGSLKMGMDLEYIKNRDFSIWHDWILSPDEHAWLHAQHGTIFAYLALWTLKESLIKANHLDWADLPHVGLKKQQNNWQLSANGQSWHGSVWCLTHRFILAVTHNQATHIHLHGLGNWANVAPQLIFHFQAA